MSTDTAKAAEAAQATVNALTEQAKEHKRESARQRRRASSLMRTAMEIAERCREVGIEVEIDIPKTNATPEAE